MNPTEIFQPFPKMARYSRPAIVTEKIDGTNASVIIQPVAKSVPGVDPTPEQQETESKMIAHWYGPDGSDWGMFAGSRTRLITPRDDNYGFARWVSEHVDELKTLGPGRHFGEWWGNKIQRAYGLINGERHFSLFNVSRWALHGVLELKPVDPRTPDIQLVKEQLPQCCGLVPVLARGVFGDELVTEAMLKLRLYGSMAAAGFMQPEGIVVYHCASGTLFKKTLDNDEAPKSLAP